MNPLVSVVMSVHNGEKCVDDAILSIRNQTYRNLEFIIIENNSTDKTPEIVLKHWNEDSRIRLLRNWKLKSLSESLNRGLSHSFGTYIARMDADDISSLNRLERQVGFMEQEDWLVASGTYYVEIDEHGNRAPRRMNPVKPEDVSGAMPFYCPIAHPTAIIRRTALGNIRYSTEFRYAQDYDLWSRIWQTGGSMANLPELLLTRRFTPDPKKMRIQELETIKIRWRIAKATHTFHYTLRLLKPVLMMLLPVKFREWLRRCRHK